MPFFAKPIVRAVCRKALGAIVWPNLNQRALERGGPYAVAGEA
jgi:hypothetical protein